jgi:hypothetical protein
VNQPEKADDPRPQFDLLTGPPVIPTDADLPDYPTAAVDALFGQHIEPGLLAAMANAPPGAHASVVVVEVPITDTIMGVQATTTFDGGEAIRIFCRPDSDGALIVQNWSIRLHMELESEQWVRVNPAVTGTDLLTNQIRALRKAGVARIWSIATRRADDDPNKVQVGYCVWPKLGYDAPIPDSIWSILPAPLKEQVLTNAVGSSHERSILSLVGTSEGEKWWEVNGVSLDECEFDLQDGSVSMRVLAAYLTSRQA